MNDGRELLELIKQNPDLPIVPMVDYEICAGDDYRYWVGSWGKATVAEYVHLTMYGDDRFLTRNEQDKIEEYFADEISDESEFDLHENDITKLVHEKAEALPWTKAIIVYIELPEVSNG